MLLRDGIAPPAQGFEYRHGQASGRFERLVSKTASLRPALSDMKQAQPSQRRHAADL